MKDYYIKGITLNSQEMADICRYFEKECIVDYINNTYPNLFEKSDIEYIVDETYHEIIRYRMSNKDAIKEALENSCVTLKRNIFTNGKHKTFECDWLYFIEAIDSCFDMEADEFAKEYTPEMGEKLYQWLIENEYIDEDEE